MTTQQHLQTISLEAAGDLSSDQFHFMELSSGQVQAVSGSGDDSVGVLQGNPAAQGRAAEVAYDGIAKVVAGAAVAQDAEVMSDASGRAITATGAVGSYQLGRALDAASGIGAVIRVQLRLPSQAVSA